MSTERRRGRQHFGEINTWTLDEALEQVTQSDVDTYLRELERYQQSPAPRAQRGETTKRVKSRQTGRAWWNDI